MATLKQRISSLVDTLTLKLNNVWRVTTAPHENVVIEVSYSDLGLLEGAEITKEDMATYISNLGMDLSRNTNYYFEVPYNEAAGKPLTFYISPMTELMYQADERTNYFPVYLIINGEQYVLDDNALFTPDEIGVKAFHNAYVSLLNTVPGITAIIDNSQDFSVDMESNLFIELQINSAVFEGDFSIRYADSDDYENNYYAVIGFTYNELNAIFYANFVGDNGPDDITSMKFYDKTTLEPFPAYNEVVDITLLEG